MTHPDNITRLTTAVTAWDDRPHLATDYHLHGAVAAFRRGHFRILETPAHKPYLVRFWLTPPQAMNDGRIQTWDSAESCLLHWILRPDPDRHLHDHPWAFTTRIIRNGYIEETPFGMVHRWPLTTSTKQTGELHRIAALLGDSIVNWNTGEGGTWTEVTTGPRTSPWGFHTPGGWIDHRQYFELNQEVIPFGEPAHEKR